VSRELILLASPLRQALERIERKAQPLLRDVIAHHYFDLDSEQVLLICQDALPGVLNAIRSLETSIRDGS